MYLQPHKEETELNPFVEALKGIKILARINVPSLQFPQDCGSDRWIVFQR